jgi:hypothetical protein
LENVLKDVLPADWTRAEFPASNRPGELHFKAASPQEAGPELEIFLVKKNDKFKVVGWMRAFR